MRLKPLIDTMIIDVLNKCNLRCKYCFIVNNSGAREIGPGLKQINAIISMFQKMGGKFLTLSGGEPLLRPDLDAIIRHALSKRLLVTILTNGTMLDTWLNQDSQILLRENGLYIQVSLDGSIPQINDFLRGNNSFSKILRSFYVVRNAGLLHKFSLAVVLTKTNIYDIPSIIELAAQLGVLSVTFTFMHFTSSDDSNIQLLIPTTNEKLWALRTLFRLRGKYKNRLTIRGEPFDNGEYRISHYANLDDFCDIGKILKITVHGDVYPCPYFNNTNYKLGNIYEDFRNIKFILNRLTQFRSRVQQRRLKIRNA